MGGVGESRGGRRELLLALREGGKIKKTGFGGAFGECMEDFFFLREFSLLRNISLVFLDFFFFFLDKYFKSMLSEVLRIFDT